MCLTLRTYLPENFQVRQLYVFFTQKDIWKIQVYCNISMYQLLLDLLITQIFRSLNCILRGSWNNIRKYIVPKCRVSMSFFWFCYRHISKNHRVSYVAGISIDRPNYQRDKPPFYSLRYHYVNLRNLPPTLPDSLPTLSLYVWPAPGWIFPHHLAVWPFCADQVAEGFDSFVRTRWLISINPGKCLEGDGGKLK